MAPPQKPGRSKQDYQTPPEFLIAVKALLGIQEFVCDLAASADNTVADLYYDGLTPETDALVPENRWVIGQDPSEWNWLNPPFGFIDPWVRRTYTAMQLGGNTAVLVPLSTARWWHRWVHGKAHVKLLGDEENSGRITFVGETTAYPKDCALLLYGAPEKFPVAYDTWDWVAEYEAVTGERLNRKERRRVSGQT